ncbi:MAG: aspartate kinase, partial [Saprospiraceae bacterium]|nr:aspartate kinase [Saprospiraceae bacterium]
MKDLKVFKFGGASVRDAAGVRNVAAIIASKKTGPLIVVVSAMGKTTDALEKVVRAHAEGSNRVEEYLTDVKNAHYKICSELFDEGDPIFDSINDTFVEIEWVLDEEPHDNYDFMYDQIVSVGELVSTKIVAAYLNKAGSKTEWVDARDIIRTDNLYREAWVQWDETIANAKKTL